MSPAPRPYLVQRSEVETLLDLTAEKVDWLVNTAQLRPIRLCGEEKFDTREVIQLIEAYKLTQRRRKK